MRTLIKFELYALAAVLAVATAVGIWCFPTTTCTIASTTGIILVAALNQN